MATVEQALITQMLATAGLTALVGQQIYFGLASQDAAAPYVVGALISAPRVTAMGSDPGVVNARFQFTAYGNDGEESKNVIGQVRAALQRYRGTVAGVTVFDCFVDNEMGPLFDVEARLYSHVMDFRVPHTEN